MSDPKPQVVDYLYELQHILSGYAALEEALRELHRTLGPQMFRIPHEDAAQVEEAYYRAGQTLESYGLNAEIGGDA